MSAVHSDTFVFFGATGDLAYKKIFPSLQSMLKRGHLNVPVIGVAKAGWNLDQLKARAKDSLEKHGTFDAAAWEKLSGLLRYVDGDYKDPATFQNLRKQLGNAAHPAHYLAIPPVMFPVVVEQLMKSGCAKGARVIVEKPFGDDLASAQALNKILQTSSASTTTLGSGPWKTCWCFVLPTRLWRRSGTATTSRVSRSRWPRISASRGEVRFTIKQARSAMSYRIIFSRFCATWRWSLRLAPTANPFGTRKQKFLRQFPACRRQILFGGSSEAIARNLAWPRTLKLKPSPPCASKSTLGGGRAFRFTFGRENPCR